MDEISQDGSQASKPGLVTNAEGKQEREKKFKIKKKKKNNFTYPSFLQFPPELCQHSWSSSSRSDQRMRGRDKGDEMELGVGRF